MKTTHPRDQVVEHLLNVADRWQVLTQVFDGISDLELLTQRFDTCPIISAVLSIEIDRVVGQLTC